MKVKYDTPFVFHFRNGQPGRIEARGGLTVVFDPVSRLFGFARCNSLDNYNKKRGVSVAKGRIAKFKKTGKKSLVSPIVSTYGDLLVEDVRQGAKAIAHDFQFDV